MTTRHLFHLPTNNPHASMCGEAGGLIRMCTTNVNCIACLASVTEPGVRQVVPLSTFAMFMLCTGGPAQYAWMVDGVPV